eukprot:COSAG04_NODE_73_length_29016_cov_7.345472_24_plen_260_part_00
MAAAARAAGRRAASLWRQPTVTASPAAGFSAGRRAAGAGARARVGAGAGLLAAGAAGCYSCAWPTPARCAQRGETICLAFSLGAINLWLSARWRDPATLRSDLGLAAETSDANETAASEPAAPEPQPGAVFVAHTDSSTGKTYYHNEQTGETCWELPRGAVLREASPPAEESQAAQEAEEPPEQEQPEPEQPQEDKQPEQPDEGEQPERPDQGEKPAEGGPDASPAEEGSPAGGSDEGSDEGAPGASAEPPPQEASESD